MSATFVHEMRCYTLHRKEKKTLKSKMVCAVYPGARQAFLLITNEEQKIRKYSLRVHPNENQARTPIISGGKFKGESRIKTLSVTRPLHQGLQCQPKILH